MEGREEWERKMREGTGRGWGRGKRRKRGGKWDGNEMQKIKKNKRRTKVETKRMNGAGRCEENKRKGLKLGRERGRSGIKLDSVKTESYERKSLDFLDVSVMSNKTVSL